MVATRNKSFAKSFGKRALPTLTQRMHSPTSCATAQCPLQTSTIIPTSVVRLTGRNTAFFKGPKLMGSVISASSRSGWTYNVQRNEQPVGVVLIWKKKESLPSTAVPLPFLAPVTEIWTGGGQIWRRDEPSETQIPEGMTFKGGPPAFLQIKGRQNKWKTRKLCYRKDYRAMRVTTQSDNTHMVCC